MCRTAGGGRRLSVEENEPRRLPFGAGTGTRRAEGTAKQRQVEPAAGDGGRSGAAPSIPCGDTKLCATTVKRLFYR